MSRFQNNKKFIVSGAASGIGASIARNLVKRGHFVFACDLTECQTTEFQQYFKLDVTQSENIKDVIKKIHAITPSIDGIVNCAGIVKAGPLMELDCQELKDIFAVNVFGMFELTKASFPLLLRAKGRIVNISSFSGKMAFPFMGPYAMSKHSVEAFSDSLRRELAPLGMFVSIIEPGKIRTPLILKGQKIVEEKLGKVSDLFRERGIKFAAFDAQRVKLNALDPEIVAEKVYHALFAVKPKTRYLIVKHKWKTKLMMRLPARAIDKKLLKLIE